MFEQMTQKQSLKFMVQKAIFCPMCDQVLDVRRAVEVEICYAESGEHIRSKVMCVSCWDEKGEKLREHMATVNIDDQELKLKLKLKAIDGRELHTPEEEELLAQPVPYLPDDVDEEDAPTMEQLEEWMMDSTCEATDGCIVEHDGSCPHGCESWLRKLGMV